MIFNYDKTTAAISLILHILQIVDLVDIIIVINTRRATIFTIAIILATVTISHEKKSTMFMAKKVVTLIGIQKMSNQK